MSDDEAKRKRKYVLHQNDPGIRVHRRQISLARTRTVRKRTDRSPSPARGDEMLIVSRKRACKMNENQARDPVCEFCRLRKVSKRQPDAHSSYLGGLGAGRCNSSRLSPGRRRHSYGDGGWRTWRSRRVPPGQDSGYATRVAAPGGSRVRPPGSWSPGSVCSAEELPSPSPRPYRSGPILIIDIMRG
ncbi:hypothetical protein PUN28_008640 [Cardiocondyla obscurior]|uniref:Uncharacterized protein n=1 Tax=Cardiocondyla obscurior TaxID=286306 RepID=A0AAW2G0H9_9HYME